MGKYQQFVYMFLSQNVHENPYLREVNVEHNKFVFLSVMLLDQILSN